MHTAALGIAKSIVIQGEDENAVFDAQNSTKFFNWLGTGELLLEQLTFKNGNGVFGAVQQTGGAISLNVGGNAEVGLSAGTARLNKCKFINNDNSGKNGGAVYVRGSNVEITMCEFEGNVSSNGGAVYIEANPVDFNASISHSLFKNNTSTTHGGALTIALQAKVIDVKLTNSTFYGNETATAGGAMFITGNATGSSLVGTNLTVVENHTNNNIGNCGGIRIIAANIDAAFNNCVVYNNWCKWTTAERSFRSDITTNRAQVLSVNSSIIGLTEAVTTGKWIVDNETVYATEAGSEPSLTLNPLNSDGVVTYSSSALAVNFGQASYLTAVNHTTDQLDMLRLMDDSKIDAGAWEYGATVPNNSFTTAIDDVDYLDGLQIYPNPVVGSAKVVLPGSGEGSVEIYSLTGKKVFSIQANDVVTIDSDQFDPGIYIVKAIVGGQNFVEKIVVR